MPPISQQGHSTNLIGVATACIASPVFNEHPKPLHIADTRESASGLFEQLARQSRLADSGKSAHVKEMAKKPNSYRLVKAKEYQAFS